MANKLSIKVIGSLDTAQTSTKINEQLKTIEKKINNIKLGVDVSLLSKLGKQVEQLQKQINQQSKGIRIIDDKEAAKNIDKIKQGTRTLFTDIEKAVKEYSKFGTVKVDTNLNPITKQLDGFILSVKRADDTVQKLKFDLAQIGTASGLKNVYELTSLKGSDNTQAIAEKVLQTQHKINSEIQQQNEQLEKNLELYKRQASVNAQNLTRRYSGAADNSELQSYLRAVNSLTTATPNLNNQMRNLTMRFREISSEVRSSSSHVMSFGEKLKVALSGIGVWGISTTMIYGTIRGLKAMISDLVEIDTLMTNIRRVMDIPDFKLNDLLSQAVGISDTLSSKLTDVLSIMDNFGRMGFTDSQMADITKTAQVLTNISDLDPQSSVDTLTSAMINFNVAAKDSITIAD